MKNFGVIILLTAWSTQASPITVQTSYPAKPSAVSRDGLEYILRSTGKFIHRPLIQQTSQNEPSTVEEPPRPESYNFFQREKPNSNPEIPDQSIEEEFETLTERTRFDSDLELPDYLKKIPKKYTSTLKQLNLRPSSQEDYQPITPIKNRERWLSLVFGESNERDIKPLQIPRKTSRTRREKLNSKRRDEENNDDNDRVQYQIHGLRGPKSYKFGYDTGRGTDRQFRDEERRPDGQVKGQYGYINTNGKTVIVKYTASPEGGFRIEKVQ